MIKHFGLKSLPFTREIQIKERVKFHFIEAESDALLSAIKCRMSAALIAPAGSGKTLVLRTIKKSLPEARYRVHYVKVTGVSKKKGYVPRNQHGHRGQARKQLSNACTGHSRAL